MRKLFLFPILLITILAFIGCSPAASTTPEPETAATPDEEAPEAEATPVEEAPPDAEGDPIRIAALLPGRIDDVSFNQVMYEGLIALQEEVGDDVELSYTEDLFEVFDIEPAL